MDGEPTEAALAVAAMKGGVEFSSCGCTVLRELPFDSQRKMMSVIVRTKGGELLMFTKGAPDILMRPLCLCAEEYGSSSDDSRKKTGADAGE